MRIFVKDEKNEKMTMGEQKIKGNGVVYDNRKKEILFVNFDNNNILSNNLYNLNTFIDRDEFEVNAEINNTKDPKSILRNIINKILSKEENIEFIANKINEKMIQEKINILGVRDQHYAPECWVHALSEIIFMSNSRKYGRNMKKESFKDIYNNITTYYSKIGKTGEEIEKIMNVEFGKNKYGLIYEKTDDQIKIKNYLKLGIKCLLTFNLNNKEWDNFCDYFQDKSIKSELKVITKEMLQRPNKKEVKDPDELEGHAVVLLDIDKDDNYCIMNSWGIDWGDKGTFKAKKDIFRNCAIYAIYFTNELLTEDEVNAWNKLKRDIKVILLEMRKEEKDNIQKNKRLIIKCPICKKSAPIKGYKTTIFDQFICPFESKCIFNITYDYFPFIAEQIYENERKKANNKNNRLDFDFLNYLDKSK